MTGHEPLTLVRFKFPKSLGNLAEPSDLHLEPGALSDFPRRQLASTRSRRIPFGEVRDVDHGLEYLLDGFVYDLDAFDYSHAVSLELPTVRAHLANIAANGRASKTVRISATFSPLTLYHSQTNAVPAAVLVTMSYRTHTSLPSAKIFFISIR